MTDSRSVWFHNETLAPGFSIFGLYWAIPVTWQGSMVLGLYVAALVAAVAILLPQRWGMFLLAFGVLTAALLCISIVKGKRVAGPGP